MIVRSIHFSFAVPDHSGTIASLFYPADEAGLDDARLTGAVAADTASTPWPVAIIVPGINVAPDSYRWLAVRLAEAGIAAVTYAAIGSLGPAGEGITPGLDMSALAPDVIGSRPSAVAIPPLLDRLGTISGTPIDGLLNLDRVALVGHSAGGTVALHNSRPDWLPGLQAVVGYGAHTMTSTSLGHEEASVVSIPAAVPVLLAVGASDGVIDQSRDRYTSGDERHDPVGRTFHEAIDRDAGDSWLVEFAGGTHFTICDPVDATSGRSFLETDPAGDPAARVAFGDVVVAFFDETMRGRADAVAERMSGPGIARWERR